MKNAKRRGEWCDEGAEVHGGRALTLFPARKVSRFPMFWGAWNRYPMLSDKLVPRVSKVLSIELWANT